MCHLQVGDLVERFFEEGAWSPAQGLPPPPLGHIGTVTFVEDNDDGEWVIELDNWPHEEDFGLLAAEYRKVERNLTKWLSTATDFEEPKRAPAKRRERA